MKIAKQCNFLLYNLSEYLAEYMCTSEVGTVILPKLSANTSSITLEIDGREIARRDLET